MAYFMDCLRGCFRDYFGLKLWTILGTALACFRAILLFVSGLLYG